MLLKKAQDSRYKEQKSNDFQSRQKVLYRSLNLIKNPKKVSYSKSKKLQERATSYSLIGKNRIKTQISQSNNHNRSLVNVDSKNSFSLKFHPKQSNELTLQKFQQHLNKPIQQIAFNQTANYAIAPISDHKNIENLYEQNLSLKKLNNQLKEQIMNQKSRNLIQKKQCQKLGKQLNLQHEYYNFYQRYDLFQKSQQPSGSRTKLSNKYGFHPVNYMITGIKYRYEKLKQTYSLKCKQVQDIIQKTKYTNIQQQSQYIKVLEQQNRKLLSEIEKYHILYQRTGQISQLEFFKSSKFIKNQENIALDHANQQNQQSNLRSLILVKNDLQQSNRKFISLNIALNSKLQQKQLQLKEKVEIISSLQKSVVLLDNEVYHKRKEISRMIKAKKDVEVKIAGIQSENSKIKSQTTKQLEKTKTMTFKMFTKQKSIFLKLLTQKEQKICKLQKQVSYLSALLKYCRPLQQKAQKDRSLSPQRDDLDEQSKMLGRSSQGSKHSMMAINRKRARTKISNNNTQKPLQDFKIGLKDLSQSFKNSDYEDCQSESSSQQNQRQPKTSRKKHSQSGYKARKISPLEVEYLKQPLKFRCMARRLTLPQIKALFDPRPESLENIKKRQRVWIQKYISMRQLKTIFASVPFILSPEENHKLCRFIVEDAAADHVFCDQDNEIERQIVRSAVRAFLGDYELPDPERCRKELSISLASTGRNLRLALDSLAAEGRVSPHKLFTVMESLGIETSQSLKDQIICQLYEKNNSSNLNSLKYEFMFEEDFL